MDPWVSLKEVGMSFIPAASVFPSVINITHGSLAHPAALIENTDAPIPVKNGSSAGSDSAFLRSQSLSVLWSEGALAPGA